ncbi:MULTISPECIES: patatin-like protein [unclassified Novosphingobium]|uniref:patatin-like protein n=1 Tax=unclassified Novosphingobium TaxID=2644732 RepID=UPI00146F1B1C|nr:MULTISPECIES: patatin-like protein [unclassified Novosphingobium]NMN03984.1 patatin-related protein [Novosphingobium sp. SG919]NMN86026.1 patatin-related protein [Novosphingobium sp. SG916]
MRQKELRLALVSTGGISLAVYMHGVTKELWHLSRASCAVHAKGLPMVTPKPGIEDVWMRLLDTIHAQRGQRLRVLVDILSGASAGGINAVFLAQALVTGQSLEPLTRLWLARADSDVLLDPDARPWGRFAKFWAQPLVWAVLRWPALRRSGGELAQEVGPETRGEVRRKVSRLIRARWFAPPFSGIGFSRLLAEALDAMARSGNAAPLLPPGHPIDLMVTATDFAGHPAPLRLNSPPVVEENEHRLAIGFRAEARAHTGEGLAPVPELVMAARATASFPGAFPPLTLAEIDMLAAERGEAWPSRSAFLQRIMPQRWRRGTLDQAALVDGAVLVNRPFAPAMAALGSRPSRREVDRRFVYLDPAPHAPAQGPQPAAPVGFLSAIFGALSTIPREQPIRDNLEALERQSRERLRLRAIVDSLQGEIEDTVARLFGHTLFFDWPNPKRLIGWRARAQQAAAQQAGYAFHGYAQVKLAGIVADLAELITQALPADDNAGVEEALWHHLAQQGLDNLSARGGGATTPAIAFFRAHDLSFRIRRLKLLARRLTTDWDEAAEIAPAAREAARDVVYRAQALYQARASLHGLGPGFAASAAVVREDPGAVLAAIAARRDLARLDDEVDGMFVHALGAMDKALRRRFLHAYLGFPFYDVATLPLFQGDGLGEFDPVKVDRISPEDATAIRDGGTRACLKGIAFTHFGAFFSRAWRENDYLWGRLNGAERLIDMVCSTLDDPLDPALVDGFKRDAFLAILDEEEPRLRAERGLVPGIRGEVEARFATGEPGFHHPPTPSSEEEGE